MITTKERKAMKKNKVTYIAAKAVITLSSMLAVNDLLGYYAPTRTSQTIHRIGNNIAGCAIGYFIGKKAADACIEGFENAVKAYKGEEEIDG